MLLQAGSSFSHHLRHVHCIVACGQVAAHYIFLAICDHVIIYYTFLEFIFLVIAFVVCLVNTYDVFSFLVEAFCSRVLKSRSFVKSGVSSKMLICEFSSKQVDELRLYSIFSDSRTEKLLPDRVRRRTLL